MATQWTEEQLTAIETHGSTLLVSAAAGSGKTAVLVERVLRRLTDLQNPVDIDHFLMVTYTNAAAAELRGKIADALTARLAQTPDDARLRRQLFLVHRAQIITVHAFCLNLAREQFAALGLSPDFRIADETECNLLLEETLEMQLEQAYTLAEQAPDAADSLAFLSLSELLCSSRDDRRLQEVIAETYHKLQSHPRPQDFLQQLRAAYTAPAAEPAQTPHGKVLLAETQAAAAYGLSCLEHAVELMENDEQVCDAYLPAFSEDKKYAQSVLDAIAQQNWDTAVQAAHAISFARLKAVRGYEDKAFLDTLKELREEWKTVAGKIRNQYLSISAAEIAAEEQAVAPAMCALIDAVQACSIAFSAEKRRRNVVDFNDLEHFAIQLLYDADGNTTPLAQELSSHFVEVLVDEYQDTNAVQDAIFHAVSQHSQNLFMVGDVKQSIYSFRLANPQIFLKKYLEFTDAAQASDTQPRRVVLSKNFRSRIPVLEATNAIFEAIMSPSVGDLAYTAQERLYAGADYENPQDPRYHTEIHCITIEKDPETGKTPDKSKLEAKVVAHRIQELIAQGFPVFDKTLGRSRPIQPSDCTILLRSVKQKAQIYAQALEEVGLTAHTEDSSGLLTAVEVRAVISLLNIIDNPRQDVELIAALRSPLIGFSEDLLAQIRICDKSVGFYDALLLAADTDTLSEESQHKIHEFLDNLNRWRMLSADFPVWQLLQMLYDETSALGIYGAQPNGTTRQNNLLAFFERARSYEAQGHRGLFHFLHMLRNMLETEQDFPAPASIAEGGAVQIMSIHKSKGLEFPVVFLADCAKGFNESDLYAPVLVHSELGFGTKCRDLERKIQYPTMRRLAIAAKARREQISEELRILYVGMTRAKEKLIITSAQSLSTLKKWANLAVYDKIPPYALGAARSSALWLIAPLLRHPKAQSLREAAECTALSPRTDLPDCFDFSYIESHTITQQKSERETSANMLSPDAVPTLPPAFVYPHEFLQDIPAKATATGLKQDYKSQETAEDTLLAVEKKPLRRPFFEQTAQTLTPSEIGTAHHLFLQFADFTRCETIDGLIAERTRMREKHILSNAQADCLNLQRLHAFFVSPLYQKRMKASKIRREFKFSVLAPAMQFYPEAAETPEEEILLQGVIDCLIETPEGYLLLDFKTDRVSHATVQERAERYRPQLEAYVFAVEKIFVRPVLSKILFFFHNGITIEL